MKWACGERKREEGGKERRVHTVTAACGRSQLSGRKKKKKKGELALFVSINHSVVNFCTIRDIVFATCRRQGKRCVYLM